MAISVTDIYRSPNGDCWQLIRDPDSGRSFVRHQPNRSSGGRTSETDVDVFLRVDGSGPEYTALRHLLENASTEPHLGADRMRAGEQERPPAVRGGDE